MLAILRQRNFALLWLGGLISFVGDWVLFIALPVYVYDLTGSALATGGMFIAQTAPRLLLGSIAGVCALALLRGPGARWYVQAAEPLNY